MRPRLLSLILLSLHLILLDFPVHALPAPFNTSHPRISFTPVTAHAIHSLNTLLALCCQDARLVSHKRLTLHHLNTLTLPLTQYRRLQSLRSLIPHLPTIHLSSSPHTHYHTPFTTRQPHSKPSSLSNRFYSKYRDLDALQEKWAHLADTYETVRLSDIGKSIEQRPIKLITIGSTDPDKPKRILINALQHAREWIAAAAATFIAEKLAINSSPEAPAEDPQLQHLLRTVEVLIVPVLNPDGYVYTHTTEDPLARYWRKNRRPLPGPCLGTPAEPLDEPFDAAGVDLNRNWPKDFGGRFSTSNDQCESTYTGTGPFSEPETKALAELIKETDGILTHIDLHSYGQVILGPWASSEDTPARFCEYDAVGKEMATAMIGSGGFRYTYDRGPKFNNGFFSASGVITDWVHDQFPHTLSFAVELRPLNPLQGRRGFELSPEQILPTSKEAFSAVRVLLIFSNDPKSFLSSKPTFTECRAKSVPPSTPLSESSTNVGLIVGAVFGAILALIVLFICLMVFRIKRRRSREKQLEEANASASDDAAKEGGSLESVCAVVELQDTRLPSATEKALVTAESEAPHDSPSHSEVLSAVSNECITPIGVDDSPSGWSNLDGESSYGNTVLLDAQNPFFPGGTAALRSSNPGS